VKHREPWIATAGAGNIALKDVTLLKESDFYFLFLSVRDTNYLEMFQFTDTQPKGCLTYTVKSRCSFPLFPLTVAE
jgi:hypothetical protein